MRAGHFQMAFRDYFRQGFMLGEAPILDGNKMLWAWGRAFREPRPFNDVAELVRNAGEDDAYLGSEWRRAGRGLLNDFISRPVDRLTYLQFGHLWPVIILLKQNPSSFKWRHFEPTIILLCVRW